jgi:hypothetical protein
VTVSELFCSIGTFTVVQTDIYTLGIQAQSHNIQLAIYLYLVAPVCLSKFLRLIGGLHHFRKMKSRGKIIQLSMHKAAFFHSVVK